MNSSVPHCLSCTQRSLLRFFASLLLLSLVSIVAIAQQQPKYDPEGELQKLDSIYRESLEKQLNGETNEDVRGRDEWFYFQRRFPYDMIPAGLRTQAVREVQAMELKLAQSRKQTKGNSLLAAESSWEQIGPYNISGRTRAIALHPSDPLTIYVGAAAGGVWKTTNGGTTWATTFDKQSALAMGAVAVDPSSPNVIYAGTGENTYNTDSYLGDGIFKSTDNGATWTNKGLNNVGAISKIVVHRQHSNIVYVAAARNGGGFYRSTDAGVTWSQVVTGNIYDLVVNPVNSDEVYISSEAIIRRSTDAGATFATATSGITTTNGTRISIAVSPSNPLHLYALSARSSSGGNDIGAVYSSTDKGANWQLKNTLPTTFFNMQGWYDNCIAVSPINENIVLVGGIDVYRSTNGGNNWTNTTNSYNGGNVHPDQHILQFDPANPSVVYLGDDGGVYASVDAGVTWDQVSLSLPTTQYYALDVDQSRLFRVYGGAQDNGSHGSFGTDKFVPAWSSIWQGDGFYMAVDLTDSNYVYAENYYGTPIKRLRVSNNGNVTQATTIDGGISELGSWSAPIAMSRVDRITLYSGRVSLWRTKNPRSTSSPTWERLLTGNTNQITAIGLSPFDAKKMVIGTSGGELRYSIDDGQTWKVSTGFPRRWVTDVVFDPVNPTRVYATFSGTGQHVYMSNDNGATFTNISGNLPDIPTNAIEIDPKDNAHLYVGTDAGVFASLDGGGFWIPYNDGMPLTAVVDLRIHRTSRTLVAATHGRSMFRINIDSKIQPLLIYPVGGETYVTPGTVSVRWIGIDAPARVSLSFDGGTTYPIFVDNVTSDSVVLTVPFIKTTTARVKVEETGTGVVLASGNFSLNPSPNVVELGNRSAKSEAIAVRRGNLWATQRGSDTILKFRTPGLVSKQVVVRKGIPGTVRDLAYDTRTDLFYVLVTDDDFSNAKIYTMDSNAVATGELKVSVTTASGIAMTSYGLALVTPGLQGKLYIINQWSGEIISESKALQGGTGERRRGLEWDLLGFTQGVSDAQPATTLPAELQRFTGDDTLQVVQKMSVVVPSGKNLVFFGLGYDPSPSDQTKQAYYASDTSGNLYRLTPPLVVNLGVKEMPTLANQSRSATISAVTPNPFREATSISFDLKSRQHITLELFSTSGERVLNLFDGDQDAGAHTITLQGAELPSGIYYVSLTAGTGERDLRPVVIMR